MPAMGLEPIRGCPQQILSLPRLPFRHAGKSYAVRKPLKQNLSYHNIFEIATIIFVTFTCCVWKRGFRE